MPSKRDPREEQAIREVAVCGHDIRGMRLYYAPSETHYTTQGVTIREHDLVPCILYYREGDASGIIWSRPVLEFFWNGQDDASAIKWHWSRFDDDVMNKLREKTKAVIWGAWDQVTP